MTGSPSSTTISTRNVVVVLLDDAARTCLRVVVAPRAIIPLDARKIALQDEAIEDLVL